MAASITACRKDKDSEPPSVRITAPGAGFNVSIPDTLTVGVAVSDDRLVESLTILIADDDGVPITSPYTVPVQASSQNIQADLFITDERILSGQYQLTAIANDGTNSARDFLPITVQAAPLRVRATYFIPPVTQAPPFTITVLDSIGGSNVFASLAELDGAAIDLDYLYTAGTGTEPFRRWGLANASPAALVANTGIYPAFFRGLRRDPKDGRIYVCSVDGHVRGFDASGGQVFSGTAPSNHIGEATAVVGDFLICAVVNPVTAQRMLVKHGYGSGVRLAEFNSIPEPVALFERDAQHVLLFGNTPSGGVILDVNTSLGGAFEMRDFPGEPLKCVERFGPGGYVLGFQSGIRRFDYQSNSVLSILPGTNADGLTFNLVTGAVLAASGSEVIAFNPVTGAIAGTQMVGHPVSRVLLRLNR